MSPSESRSASAGSLATDGPAPSSPAVLPAREQAEQVRRSVNGGVTTLLDAAEAPPGDIYVGWTAAQDVAVCPARFLRDGEDGFGFPGWSPPLAAAAAARVALAFHLRATGADAVVPARVGPAQGRPAGSRPFAADNEVWSGDYRPGHAAGSAGDPDSGAGHGDREGGTGTGALLPDPVGAVRAWMTACAQGHSRTPVGDWIAEQVRGRQRAVLAATAAGAARWIGGFIRAVGWPLPDDLRLVHGDREDPGALNWPRYHRVGHRRTKVTVAGSPDAVLGRPTPSGDHRLLVHRPTGPGDEDLADRAGFEATAAALSHGVVPRQVVVTAGDTGETGRVPVDEDLLDRGAELVVAVVRERLAATAADVDPAARATPSAACIWCDHIDRCAPGRTWRDGPGRWSGGLPVLTS